ncbi:NAD(P)/FAD-dependent oxidoreductase [Amycolatopsis panacis]|uniref:Ferredoxin reductase n=1 Tax=Amycolatopsis panacis TaxID=2340917 RepID=A0A419I7J1_9PSEU|nr:FAD-dependent oxidoreductase [Amycolatopsis panacis]RJQ87867.1 ferredoxin reductase [Amycolatopsis panacis]
MDTSVRVLVVGASVAAGALIGQLRADGFAGRVLVVDQDPDAPYDRPPLSKEFLGGETPRPEAPWWDERCELIRGRATSLDVTSAAVKVDLADGPAGTIGADHIVLATGSAPIRLPDEPDGVAQLRTAADARRIRDFAAPGRRVLILGAGTIGTELASSLAGAGCDVAIVDQADRPLDRFLGGHLGDVAAEWIRAAGVELRLGCRVARISRAGERWTVSTSAGDLSGDLVVSAIGARPATGWLAGSGLDVTNGVRCDAHGAALDASGAIIGTVQAIGDVAAWCEPGTGPQRYEDWTTAQRQGRHVAKRLMGGTDPADFGLPYFWTHQFGRRIQVLGHPKRDGDLVQHTGNPARNAAYFTVRAGGADVACVAINSPREFAGAMRTSLRESG